MSGMTPEYAARTFTRLTSYDRKERCVNDYGPPERLYYQDKVPMTKEEEEAYYELRQREEDMTNDLIPY